MAVFAGTELIHTVACFDLPMGIFGEDQVSASGTGACALVAGDDAYQMLADIPHAGLRCLFRKG